MSLQDGVIVSIKVTNLVTSQLLRLRIAISIGLPAGAGNERNWASQKFAVQPATCATSSNLLST